MNDYKKGDNKYFSEVQKRKMSGSELNQKQKIILNKNMEEKKMRMIKEQKAMNKIKVDCLVSNMEIRYQVKIS